MAKLTVDKVNVLIDEMMGNVSMVARTLNISRTTLYNYINSHSTVKAKLDEAREKMIDNVESKLYSKALDGDTTAMIFFLKTQGKGRGYVERQEVTGAEVILYLPKKEDHEDGHQTATETGIIP
jgi:hypothetical protein